MDGNADPTAALALPGVVAFIDYRDIPGQNKAVGELHLEEIFSSGKIHYAGQAVGLVVAETREIAIKAASLVEVSYKNKQRQVVCNE